MFSVIYGASKSHIYIAVLSLLPVAVLRQSLWVGGSRQWVWRTARRRAAAAGQWGWCYVPLALLTQTGNLLDSFNSPWTLAKSAFARLLGFSTRDWRAGGGRGELTAADLAQPPLGALASQQSHSQGKRWGSTASPEQRETTVPIPGVCSYLLFPLVPTAFPKLQVGYKQFGGDCELDWSQSLLKLLLYFSFWRALQHFLEK